MMHIEPQVEVLADALEKLASHDVGRAAFASIALGDAGCATPMTNQDTPETQVSWAFDKDNPPLLKFWQNFASAMELEESNPAYLRLVLRFAQVANVLTDSGQRYHCLINFANFCLCCIYISKSKDSMYCVRT